MSPLKNKTNSTTTFSKMWALTQFIKQKSIDKSLIAEENPELPTVALDLDGTLVHTVCDPNEAAAAEKSGLITFRLPGNMGLVVQRPGLEQLFASLLGYNVVVFSAGASAYVNTVLEFLIRENPILQGRFCKVLCRDELTKYSETSPLPNETSLNGEGVCYVKDLRKTRSDGNADKVLLVDDNELAYQVDPRMKDSDFKTKYNFTKNALPVPEFSATDPKASSDTAFSLIGRVLKEIAGVKDTVSALRGHPALAELKKMQQDEPEPLKLNDEDFLRQCSWSSESSAVFFM